jgi:capsular polysaccharide biosynthesis protein
VLLAGARPGQQRPSLAEAVNLIISGLGVRLRLRWLIVGALTCMAAIGVLAYTLIAPNGYAATAAVVISPTGADQTQQSTAGRAVPGAVVNLDTEARRVTSETVATLAARLMHSSLPPSQLSGGVTVSVPQNSAILNITCHAPTTTVAATCANAFAEAYLQNRDASWRKQAQGSWGTIITVASPGLARGLRL